MPSAPLELPGGRRSLAAEASASRTSEPPSSREVSGSREAEPGKTRASPRPRFQARKKRRSLWALSLGALCVIGAGSAIAVELRPEPVTTTMVVRGTALEAAYATGTVEPFDRAIVKAKAAGSIDLKVREGARVKKGDLVAVIDSPALAHDFDRGKVDLWAASQQADVKGPQFQALEAQARALKADLNTAEGDTARFRRLVTAGSAAQADLDHVIDRSAALSAQLEANQAQQNALRIDLAARKQEASAQVGTLAARLADAEVRAPLDGVVLARFVEPGEVAAVNTPLIKIGNTDDLILECAIDEADMGRVSVGQKVAISLYAFSETVYGGRIFDILPDADRAKKSFLAKVRLDQPPAGLRSGMTAEVNVVIQERPGALLVPAGAVDGLGRVRVVADGRVQTRTPKLGVRDMLRVEVTGGLKEGDEVIVAGGDALGEGARVRTIREAPEDASHPPKSSRSGMSL